MKHYSHEARTTLLELHNEFIHNVLFDGNGKYRHSPLNDYGVHYQPDDEKFYDTATAAFKELPYEVIKYYCSGWTGYLHGVETCDFLKEYASEFGIKLLSETEHDDLWKEDECEADVSKFFVKLRDNLIRHRIGYSENLGDIFCFQKSFIHIALLSSLFEVSFTSCVKIMTDRDFLYTRVW